ncbi:hypothetical protein, partial [Limnobacter sp.]|uniref:hypothetical protein n=1 Tax=Limnobacter sp. TaxID=2003368 RepID=UPI002E353F1C
MLIDHVGEAVELLRNDDTISGGSVNQHIESIKEKVCESVISDNSKLRNPNLLISAVARALPSGKESSVSAVKDAVQTLRTNAFFSLISTASTNIDNAVDPQQRFADASDQICENTKTALLLALPNALVQELDLPATLGAVQSVSDLTGALKTALSNPANNGNEITRLRNSVNGLVASLVSSTAIPPHILDPGALRTQLNSRVLDLAYIEKTRQSNPAKAQTDLGKLCSEAVKQAMIGDVRANHGNEAVRIASINQFVADLKIKGGVPTGNVTNAVVALSTPTSAFASREILPRQKWGMSESGRRTFIAQQVVGVLQKVTRTTADPSQTLKDAFVGNNNMMRLLPAVKVRIRDYAEHLIVGASLQLSGSHDVLRKLTLGALASAGVDSQAIKDFRDPTVAFQKPVVITKQSMIQKSLDRPQGGAGLLKRMTRTQLPVERNDHAGRALVFHRQMQMAVAKALFQNDRGEVGLNRFVELVGQAGTNADLFNLASLVVVAAGDTQLTSVNGLDLISNMFELERNTAVLPTDEVKNQLVNNVRA